VNLMSSFEKENYIEVVKLMFQIYSLVQNFRYEISIFLPLYDLQAHGLIKFRMKGPVQSKALEMHNTRVHVLKF
jgi:hypothetical protein